VEDVGRPRGGCLHRRRRGAEARHLRAEQVLEHRLALAGLLAELLRVELGQRYVTPGVQADFVTGGGDLAHQRRVALPDLAHHEHRAPYATVGDERQHLTGQGGEPLRPTVVGPVVLDVEREGHGRRRADPWPRVVRA